MVALYPIVIEEMRLDDIDAVQEVERASFPVPWPANAFRHELTQNKNAHYVIAREGDRIVGYAGLWLSLDEAHITTFAVLPEHRRRKIGERVGPALVGEPHRARLIKTRLDVPRVALARPGDPTGLPQRKFFDVRPG